MEVKKNIEVCFNMADLKDILIDHLRLKNINTSDSIPYPPGSCDSKTTVDILPAGIKLQWIQEFET